MSQHGQPVNNPGAEPLAGDARPNRRARLDPTVLRVYRALFLAQFQMTAAYRVQSLLWLLFALIRPVIFLAAWSAVAAALGGGVAGLDARDFAAYYVCLTLVIQLTTAWNSWEFQYEVQQGRLAPKLLRPLHPIHYAIVENVVWKLVSLVALIPALAVLAWTFDARFTTEWWHVLLFFPTIIFAAVARFLAGWVLALAAFWTTRVESINILFDRGAFVLGGQIAPIALLQGVAGRRCLRSAVLLHAWPARGRPSRRHDG